MNLHKNNELFKEAVTATAQKFNIPEIYVEKDYWITLALKLIFQSDVGKEIIFKGGTALVKCNKMISRFSEDIDLVMLRRPKDSNNQLKSRLKQTTNCINEVMPEILISGITNKKGMIRKTAHTFNKIFEGQFGQVRNHIILEATWLGNYEPYQKGYVSSLIYETFQANNLTESILKFDLSPFEVQVLSPKRTFCEKIMSLVRFSFTKHPVTDLKNKIRHIYDIHMMLSNDEIKSFYKSEEFHKLLLIVAKDDVLSFKNNNSWLANHPATAMIFENTVEIWDRIKQSYFGDFKDLVFGYFPTEEEILKTLNNLSTNLKIIEWDIKIKKS